MAKLDLSFDGISMLYLQCNELQKEYVLLVEETSLEQKEHVKKINELTIKINLYLNAFILLQEKIVEKDAVEYMNFIHSDFVKNTNELYKEYIEKYSMYREYLMRGKK